MSAVRACHDPPDKYNMQKNILDIPGWMNEKDLKILHTLASYVPENGSILEIGSFLGLSTTSLYRGKHKSVSLEVIDNFNTLKTENFKNMKFSLRHATEYEDFEKINQIVTEQGWHEGFRYCIGDEMYNDISVKVTSSELYNRDNNFNLTFIDGSHTYGSVKHDIIKYATDDNLLVGDDYAKQFAGVLMAVGENRNAKTLIVSEKAKIWILVPCFGYWRDVFKNNNLLFLD